MASPEGYSRLQIALHWLIALLVAAAWFTGDGMGRALRNRIEQDLSGLDGATTHTILGGLAFAFILWRMIVRWRRGAPDPEGSPLQVTAATWGHRVLYLLMLLAPALGAATWYGKISDLGDIHAVVGQALVLIALAHAAVAVFHHVVQKDETLRRMIRLK